MQTIATAGHVDHGKSTLVRALTGMEPDRWAEERRRGLTIDLGFAWMDPVRVRAIESMDQPAGQVRGVARVALNLRGVARDIPARGMALVQPGRWTQTSTIDVRLVPRAGAPRLPRELIVHTGSARTPARVRVLGGGAGPDAAPGDAVPAPDEAVRAPGDAVLAPDEAVLAPDKAAALPGQGPVSGPPLIARLALREPLPLHAGDRVLLRDPGAAGLFILGATVLDVAPPPLRRRGAAGAAGAGYRPLARSARSA